MGYDPRKSVYMNPDIEYIFNEDIIEYDIQDAGFSLIKQFRLLPDDKIRELASMDKGFERHKAIGILQRDDKVLSKNLSDKFADVRRIFISTNNLTDNNIIGVKKDAVYTIGQCQRLVFGKVRFVPKNRYTSYIRFSNVQNLEIYYSSDGIDIKGISEHAINRHRLYMMEFLRTMIPMIEERDPGVKRYLSKFVREYKLGELTEAYYLEFNSKSRDINPMFNFQNIIVPCLMIILKEME